MKTCVFWLLAFLFPTCFLNCSFCCVIIVIVRPTAMFSCNLWHVSSRTVDVTEPQCVADVSVAQCEQSVTTMFLASRQMRLKTIECFLFFFLLTQFPVCVASVIESDRDSVRVGCGLVTMTPQSSFWEAHDSGQRPTVTVQLFAVVKHLNSGSRVKKKKKRCSG